MMNRVAGRLAFAGYCDAARGGGVTSLIAGIDNRHLFSTTSALFAQGASSGGDDGSPSTRKNNGRAPPKNKRTVFFKIEGQPSFVKLSIPIKARTVDVADLTRNIMKELPSLAAVDPSAVTLHVAKDKDGNELGDALDATDSLTDARIVVKVAGAAPTSSVFPLSASYDAGTKLLRSVLSTEPQVPDQATATIDFSEHGAMTIHASGGAEFPQLDNQAPLFVRSFYMDCITGALSDLDPSCTASCRRYIITGNGGIGKSAFGTLVLYHALRQRPARNVIYLSSKTPHAWLFRAAASGDGGHDVVPFLKADLDALDELSDPRTVYISDSLCPQQVKAFTIMVSAPTRKSYKDFHNATPCDLLVFPPLTWPEIQAMRDTCFPHMNIDTVRERYEVAGGIPRDVFFLSLDQIQQQVDSALTKVSLGSMVLLLNSSMIESEDNHSHRLLHMMPKGLTSAADGSAGHSPSTLEFYRPGKLEFASKEVARRVYATLHAADAHRSPAHHAGGGAATF